MDRSCPPEIAALVGDEPWVRHAAPAAFANDAPEAAATGDVPGADSPALGEASAGAGQQAALGADGAGLGLDTRWPGPVWWVGEHLVRRGPDAAVEAEVARHRWLTERMSLPPLVTALDAGGEPAGQAWLATAPVGAPAHQPERQPVPDTVPAELGAGMRRMHDLAADECPFDTGWDVRVAAISAAVAEGRLDTAVLPEPYGRYGPERLLELLAEGRPATEDLVVCHGNPVLPNLFLADGRTTGPTTLYRLGVADRHVDLAIVHRSIQALFGGEAVFGFYEGYGADPDLVRLDHYILLDVLDVATTSNSTSPGATSGR